MTARLLLAVWWLRRHRRKATIAAAASASLIAVLANLVGIASFLDLKVWNDEPPAPFEKQRARLVADAADRGQRVVDTWLGDLQPGPQSERQLYAVVLRAGDGRSDEIVVRDITADRESVRHRPKARGLRFTGLQAIDLDQDGRRELVGAFQAPAMRAASETKPIAGMGEAPRPSDVAADGNCNGVRLCHVTYPVVIAEAENGWRLSLRPLLTRRPDHILLGREDIKRQTLNVPGPWKTQLQGSYPSSLIRAELFSEWYAYRRPVDLRPVDGKHPMLGYGASSYGFTSTDDGVPTIVTLYVVRRRYVARGVATHQPQPGRTQSFAISTEPAEQPDLVQLGLSRLPLPLRSAQRERPCRVYASHYGQIALLARVSTKRNPDPKRLMRPRQEKFNCEELPHEGETPYRQPTILRFPRKLSGSSSVKRLCDESRRTTTPLLHLLEHAMEVGGNLFFTGAWAAERLAETAEDVEAAVELQQQPKAAFGVQSAQLVESYRALAVVLAAQIEERERDIEPALDLVNHRITEWNKIASQAGIERC